jgi:hypothetical protein
MLPGRPLSSLCDQRDDFELRTCESSTLTIVSQVALTVRRAALSQLRNGLIFHFATVSVLLVASSYEGV